MNFTASRTRHFYVLMGCAMAAMVLFGFSRTYYAKAWFDTPSLSLLLHAHAAVLTLWLALFIAQARLAAVGRYALHRQLGIASAITAGFIVLTSLAVAIEGARLNANRPGIAATDRLYSGVLVIALFALLVSLGIALRKRHEIHKRLMLLATINILGPALTRGVAIVAGHGIRDPHLPVMAGLVLAAAIYDCLTRRRPHWVWIVGGSIVIGLQATRRLVGGSNGWTQIANWLIQP